MLIFCEDMPGASAWAEAAFEDGLAFNFKMSQDVSSLSNLSRSLFAFMVSAIKQSQTAQLLLAFSSIRI